MNNALKKNKIFLSKAMKKANKCGLYLCDYLEFIASKSIEDMKQRHKRRFGAHIQPNEIKQIGSHVVCCCSLKQRNASVLLPRFWMTNKK